MEFSNKFLFLMMVFILVTAGLYLWIFDSRPEPEYPAASVSAELIDGVFRLIMSSFSAGWIALVIALFCEISGLI